MEGEVALPYEAVLKEKTGWRAEGVSFRLIIYVPREKR
jgi:hypothetical protein